MKRWRAVLMAALMTVGAGPATADTEGKEAIDWVAAVRSLGPDCRSETVRQFMRDVRRDAAPEGRVPVCDPTKRGFTVAATERWTLWMSKLINRGEGPRPEPVVVRGRIATKWGCQVAGSEELGRTNGHVVDVACVRGYDRPVQNKDGVFTGETMA